MDGSQPGISTRAAYAIVLYALLVFSLPFVADLEIPPELFVVLWLGAPCLAAFYAPLPPLTGITLVAGAVLTVVLLTGALDSEFLSDPLSIIALAVLTGGELTALLAGSKLRARKLAA